MKTMKANETLKVYGATLNTWKAQDEKGRDVVTQYEIAYKEYDVNGNLISAGSEDFSPARKREELGWYRIWMWGGNHYNKGGHRYFDPCGDATIRRADVYKLKQLAAIWNANRNPQMIDVRA